MSTLKVNNLQVGQDGTAANNYTLYQPASPDGTVRLGYGVAGSVTDILTLKNSSLGIGTNNPSDKLSIVAAPNSLVLGAKDSTRGNHIFQLLADDSAGNGELRLYQNSGSGTHTKTVEIASSGNTYFTGGNVGIGTNNPSSTLQVGLNPNSGNGAGVSAGSNGALKMARTNDADQLIEGYKVGDSSPNFVVRADGRVGIGTSNPTQKLHVEGHLLAVDGSSGLLFEEINNGAALWLDGANGDFSGGDYYGIIANNSAQLQLGYAGALDFVLTSAGNVGINRTDPNQKLNISGNIEVNAYDSANAQGGYYTAKGLIIGNAYDAGKTTTDDRNAIIWQERGLDLDIATNDTLRMKITYDGNVNIGNKNHLSHHSTVDSLQIGYALNLYEDSYSNGTDNYVVLGNNVHYNSGNKYMRNDEASRIMMQAGTFYFQTAAAGTAGNAISFTDVFRITNTGSVGINTSTPLEQLHVNILKSSGSTTAERTKQHAAMRLSLDRTTGSMPYLGWGPALDFYSDNYDGATQRPNARIAGVVSNYSAGHEGGQLRFYTTPTDTATSESDFVERYRIESSGMIRHSGGHGNNGGNMNASAYYRIVASATVPASGNVTFVISGLASGWMTIRSGGYSNAGQSQYSLMYQLGGYMTATSTYDVVTVQQWGSNVTISTAKNAQDYRVTLTNGSGSYGLNTNWIIEGSNAGIKIRT